MTRQCSASFALWPVAALWVGCAQTQPLEPRPVDPETAVCPRPDYPLAARRSDATGTTRVSYRIQPSGAVSDAWVTRKSGETPAHAVLDEAALTAVGVCRFAEANGYAPVRASQDCEWRLE